MRTLKQGCSGPDVAAFQQFLRGGQCDANGECTVADASDGIVCDGMFGPATAKATKAWQASRNLVADGIVGSGTWAAAVKDGFPSDAVPTTEVADQVVADPDAVTVSDSVAAVDKTSPSWPQRPSWAQPLVSQAEREAVLGVLTYVAAPTATNPEAVHITNDFVAKNLGHASIPQLSPHPIAMHRLAVPQFEAWFRAIAVKGLNDRIISFAGCWVPRYVRGSRKTLSNHSWGSAIDINVPWNRRGQVPALYGMKGCVRELAEFCYDFGIFWGGAYKGAPLDGMHFEIFKVLSADELTAAKAKHGVA